MIIYFLGMSQSYFQPNIPDKFTRDEMREENLMDFYPPQDKTLECRLSKSGYEYTGKKSTNEHGHMCATWFSTPGIMKERVKVHPELKDNQFPDGN